MAAGRRGVVGSVQDGPAVILAVVAASLATRVGGDPQRGRPPVVAEVLADRLGDTLRAVDALSD